MVQNHRRRDWIAGVEAVGVFAAIMVYIWLLRAAWEPAWLFILAVIVLSHRLRNERAQELGFCLTGLRESLIAVLPVLLLVVLVLLALGTAFDTVRSVTIERSLFNLARYLAWGLFQQYLLNGYFVNRLLLVYRENQGRCATVLAAVLFSGAHVPNIFLMFVGLIGAYICARLYLRYRNLLLLGILHGFIGFSLHLVVPGSISHYFLVGPGYFAK